ncbi:MAG: hypothetical protein ASARMPRED_002648 [Alectoria sarmentosa]|nr:MAG: hypothetical protein ASARMPRED_002648 [Alectoria sarmentosa]
MSQFDRHRSRGVSHLFRAVPASFVQHFEPHVPSFFKELEDLKQKGLNTEGRIFISDRAHVVFDLHQLIDGLEEQELGKGAIGTTKQGIGPVYSTKSARSGVRISEIFHKETLDGKLRTLAHGFQKRYGDFLQYDVELEIARFDDYRTALQPFVVDAVPLISSAQGSAETNILVEGANALMLDVDYGTYPCVTSSNTGIGGVFTGLALNPFKIKEIIGVVKCYTTRVGAGPLPTEQLNENGEKLQSIGWLDLVIVKYSTAINHYTALNLTKLDIMDDFPEIQIATAYQLDGQVLDFFPADLQKLERAEVLYTTLSGWQKPTTGAKSYYDLPKNARAYVEFIEKFVGVKVRYIGTGPAREDMIMRS